MTRVVKKALLNKFNDVTFELPDDNNRYCYVEIGFSFQQTGQKVQH